MDKQSYCESLCDFYNKTEPSWGLISLDYEVEGLDEWVRASFKSGASKRFNVNYDNNKGIFFDFVKFISNFDDYEWCRDGISKAPTAQKKESKTINEVFRAMEKAMNEFEKEIEEFKDAYSNKTNN